MLMQIHHRGVEEMQASNGDATTQKISKRILNNQLLSKNLRLPHHGSGISLGDPRRVTATPALFAGNMGNLDHVR